MLPPSLPPPSCFLPPSLLPPSPPLAPSLPPPQFPPSLVSSPYLRDRLREAGSSLGGGEGIHRGAHLPSSPSFLPHASFLSPSLPPSLPLLPSSCFLPLSLPPSLPPSHSPPSLLPSLASSIRVTWVWWGCWTLPGGGEGVHRRVRLLPEASIRVIFITRDNKAYC